MQVRSVYFIVYVADMDRAVRFYQQAFGFERSYGSPQWTSLQLGNGQVGLHGGRSDTDTRAIGLGLDVDDIEAAVARAVEAGARVSHPPQPREGEPIILAKVIDTEGNELTLSADKPDRVR